MYFLSNKFFNDMRVKNGDEGEKDFTESINDGFHKVFQNK